MDKLGKAGALEFVLYNNVKVGEDGKTATYDKKDVIIDGSMLKTAEAATQQDSTTGQSENVVKLSFNAKGTKKFKKVTTDHVGEQFSIIYDGEIVSSPVTVRQLTVEKPLSPEVLMSFQKQRIWHRLFVSVRFHWN